MNFSSASSHRNEKLASNETEIKQRFTAFEKLGQEYVQCDERGLFDIHPEANCIDLEYPPKLERLPFFARLLATLGYDDTDFAGARSGSPRGECGTPKMRQLAIE